jgi:hypothetical protein
VVCNLKEKGGGGTETTYRRIQSIVYVHRSPKGGDVGVCVCLDNDMSRLQFKVRGTSRMLLKSTRVEKDNPGTLFIQIMYINCYGNPSFPKGVHEYYDANQVRCNYGELHELVCNAV